MIHIGEIIQQEALKQRFTNPKIAKITGKTANGVRKQFRNTHLNTELVLKYCKLFKINFFYKIACDAELAGLALPKVENPLPMSNHVSEPKIEYTTKAVKSETNDDLDLVSITITMPRHKSEKILEILQSK
jgi:hypothetical protein